jgi:hypothetical protein
MSTTIAFDKAKWFEDSDGLWLCLRPSYPRQARLFVEEKKDRLYDAEIKEHREKRSIQANSYCWKLLGELGKYWNKDPKEIYQKNIQTIGGNYEIVAVLSKAADSFKEKWECNGIGWMAVPLESKLDGCTKFVCYYGSSTYDTHQMSQLIDRIIDDCKDAGIGNTHTRRNRRYEGGMGQRIASCRIPTNVT